MKKEEIESNELKRLIALKAGKIDFEDVTDEELEQVRDIVLNAYLINGKKSDISLDAITLFPNLERLRIVNFEITDEVIEKLASLERLSSLEILGATFSDVDFSKLSKKLENINFTNCTSLPFKYPEVRNVAVTRCGIDFKNINFGVAENILIQNSIANNAHNLDDYTNIKRINLDGTVLYDEQEKILEDILVAVNTQYSHEKETRYYDSDNRE